MAETGRKAWGVRAQRVMPFCRPVSCHRFVHVTCARLPGMSSTPSPACHPRRAACFAYRGAHRPAGRVQTHIYMCACTLVVRCCTLIVVEYSESISSTWNTSSHVILTAVYINTAVFCTWSIRTFIRSKGRRGHAFTDKGGARANSQRARKQASERARAHTSGLPSAEEYIDMPMSCCSYYHSPSAESISSARSRSAFISSLSSAAAAAAAAAAGSASPPAAGGVACIAATGTPACCAGGSCGRSRIALTPVVPSKSITTGAPLPICGMQPPQANAPGASAPPAVAVVWLGLLLQQSRDSRMVRPTSSPVDDRTQTEPPTDGLNTGRTSRCCCCPKLVLVSDDIEPTN